MRAYFETDNGALYHGDAMDILPQIYNSSNLMVTDPPYLQSVQGGGFVGNKKHFEEMDKADINSFNPIEFLEIWNSCSSNHNAYIFCSKSLLADYIRFFDKYGIKWEILLMNKNNPVPAKNNKYLSDIEYIFFTRGKDCYFNNNANYNLYRKIQNINVRPSEYGHPTEKQVHHIEKYIMISSREGETVVDPFAGSGTTAVACENLKRKWILIEKKELFCEMSSKRIEKHLNQTTLW